MDCRTLQLDLDALLAGARGDDKEAEARRHLAECAACRAYLADVQTLRHALARKPDERMPAATRNRLLRNRRNPGMAAAAATVLLAAVVGTVWYQLDRTQPVDVVQDSDWTTATVRLNLQSTEALSGVTFHLELPQGTALDSHPGKRSLTWEDNLAAGSNELRIPLIVTGTPEGELVARLEHQGRSRELRLSPEDIARLGQR